MQLTFGPWKVHEAALMLVECDSRAQRTFFRTFDLDSRCSKQFCPPLMESDWNDLVGRVIDTILANEVRKVGA